MQFSRMRTSFHVPSFDGTLLALDLYRPALGTGAVPGKFPVILISTRYQRRSSSPMVGDVDLVAHGYVVAVLDQRGAGASFGTRRADYTPEEARDTAWIVEWLADQPWSSGRVAMVGSSYRGITQYLTAAERPRGLVAIAPTVASFDAYDRTHPGGMGIPQGFITAKTRAMDLGLAPFDGPMSVDDDHDGSLLAAARRDHATNIYPDDVMTPSMARDSVVAPLGYAPGVESDPSIRLDAIRESGVEVLHTAGWFDGAPGGQLGAFVALGGRIVIGPWTHWSVDASVTGGEHLRFLDRVLRGIPDPEVVDKPVRYATVHAAEERVWTSATTWPPPDVRSRQLFLTSGPSGTVSSVNDGILAQIEGAPGRDEIRVDDEVQVFDGTYDKLSRTWDGDLTTGLDERGLTYTSAPMEMPTQVTGHPSVTLTVSSSHADAAVFVFLEDVEPSGASRYMSDGVLRLSHRALDPHREPWARLGVPFHPGCQQDLLVVTPDEPVEIEIGLFPTSYVVRTGHRLRLTVTGSFDQYYPRPEDLRGDDRTLAVHHGGSHRAELVLPVVDQQPETRCSSADPSRNSDRANHLARRRGSGRAAPT